MVSIDSKLINFLKKKGGLASYAEIIDAGFHKALKSQKG